MGDYISAIRVVEGQRKAEREIDPESLNGELGNGNGQAGHESHAEDQRVQVSATDPGASADGSGDG